MGSQDAQSSKSAIIDTLRRQIVDQVSLPETVEGPWIEYPDPVGQFQQAVELVGGACKTINSQAELKTELEKYEQWQSAQRIFSRIPDVPGNVDLDATDAPHDLNDLDFVVYPGDFAVAENGAVWLTDTNIRHRVIFFITQFLVLVVKKESIKHNMHQAYAEAKVPQPGFGLFLSGPSKTADIEQSLVIGAHGCRELQVFVV